jgi:hypothetical protein
MFKKTNPNPQMDMFSSPVMLLNVRASKKYSDPKEWHNQFYRFYTSKVDESLFKVLFPEGKKSGRPTASIRVIVCMSWLKEGFGCSDEELFEKCEFDLLTRKALGLELISDAPPSLDTYYLFRRRLCDYAALTGVDLMKKCFEQVTGGLVRDLNISGKCIRMDSKLIGSNIARQSRYELIHGTLVKYLKSVGTSSVKPELEAQAAAYLAEDSSKTVYRSDSEKLQGRLLQIGSFILDVLSGCKEDDPASSLLRRVFEEQYTVLEGKAVLRNKADVKADSVQNPNDPDATYRAKNDQKVQGYVTNITETVEDGKPSIITSVQVEKATFADCHFLQEAVENSERVTNATVEDLYADGAYQSPENRSFAEGHGNMKLKTGKMQGGARWELELHEHDDGLTVREVATGKTYEAVKSETFKGKHKRWRIPWDNKAGWRYFQDTEVEAYQLRKQIESLPPEEQHRRNNVEAAMFQYSFHTRNGKTRYRGLLKHRMQAYARCVWMNLRRVVGFLFSAFQKPCFALWGALREAFGCFWTFFHENLHQTFACHFSTQMAA